MAANARAAEVDFARDVRPILSDKCFFCHGPDENHREAGLRLDLESQAFSEHDGIVPFVAGDLDASEAWRRISADDPDEVMPPPKANKSLTAAEKETIRKWIESGAEWMAHWSFRPPEAAPAPGVKPEWKSHVRNDIDRYVLAELEGSGLEPSPEASRRTLIRRVTFDLTGLPPTPEEVDAFLQDDEPGAFARVVDRLLASEHYGERMALMWLDAARYGDTSVMHADGPRTMWPWRDWVVEAYNENMPFDRFSIDQLAGDLLPDPDNDQLVATGFNRNHPSSDEGGAIPEELRVGYVVDRVKTTSNVWLGLSMECAQCHDHKYDPVSQEEYYEFYAFFNNTTDPGMQSRRGNEAPVVEVVDDREEKRLDELETHITQATEAVEKAREQALAKAETPGGTKAPADDAKQRLRHLAAFYPLDQEKGRVLLDARGSRDAMGEKAVLPAPESQHGGALKFDGQRVFDAPEFPKFDRKSKFTLAAWIKPASAKAGGAVLSRMDVDNQHRGYDLWLQGGRPGAHFIHEWPGNALKVVAKEPLAPGEWHHVAVTYDGSGKRNGVKIYVDGESVPHSVEGKAKRLRSTMKTNVPFRIGGRLKGAKFQGLLDDVHVYDRALTAEQVGWAMRDLVAEARTVAPDQRTDAQRAIVRAGAFGGSDAYTSALAQRLELQREKAEILSGEITSMIMEDNPPEKMRKTYVLERGQYDSPRKDEVIEPDTPSALPPMPADAPDDRLGLARWLFSEEHPLTARVAVNRIWQLFFGEGLVRTPADFGAQGDFPSHPELLDRLAVDFRESGWDVKQLVRRIVLSGAYRQSSNMGPKDREIDPDNRLLARAPRFRLQAEMIRDNALALSGLLVEEMGGPGVKPYQPEGLWKEVALGGNAKFVQDHGDDLYRRSLYTYWKRSAPPPAMTLFDAPNRETCTLKRPRTNTPLQALVTMNDVQMMEASRHFAERVMKEGGDSPKARARHAFELATARPPESGELASLLRMYRQGLEKFEDHPEKSQALLSAGESERDETLETDEHAAWTVVASLILNLDEVLVRN